MKTTWCTLDAERGSLAGLAEAGEGTPTKRRKSIFRYLRLTWTSCEKRSTRFSLTIPSEAAKKARMLEMNSRSSSFSEAQFAMSFVRSTWPE